MKSEYVNIPINTIDVNNIDKRVTINLANSDKYLNYLSCQIPPPSNSPPSTDLINRYITYKLNSKKLNLDYRTYNNYT